MKVALEQIPSIVPMRVKFKRRLIWRAVSRVTRGSRQAAGILQKN
jgi:hypothetical protein